MKKVIGLLSTVLFLGWSFNAAAFTCRVQSTGQGLSSGTADVRVNLTPSIGIGQNLVVDLSSDIQCKNDSEPGWIIRDFLNLRQGSTFGGALASFSGTVFWNNQTYPLPLNGNTNTYTLTHRDWRGLPLRLYLTAIGVRPGSDNAATGIAIKAGELVAILNMHKVADDGNPADFVWRIYANNNVVIPVGGCDVSARDVTVTLPVYPGTQVIPASVRCAQNQQLSFYLSGTTANTANNIFANSASAPRAQGIGVQIRRNGGILQANTPVSLGTVGPAGVNLGLSATYGLTGTPGQVTAGNVQSIIGVTFTYQ